MRNIVITIARQYGSGGKTIGAMLAHELGINCYSREILRMASEDSGINEQLFGMSDEKVRHAPWFRLLSRPYDGELLTPERTCRETLWGRIRARTLRLITSRYATAAAAVALALTMLWGGRLLPDRALPPEGETPLPERIEEMVTAWAQWPRALTEALSGLTDFLDHPGAPAPAEQGGHQP